MVLLAVVGMRRAEKRTSGNFEKNGNWIDDGRPTGFVTTASPALAVISRGLVRVYWTLYCSVSLLYEIETRWFLEVD